MLSRVTMKTRRMKTEKNQGRWGARLMILIVSRVIFDAKSGFRLALAAHPKYRETDAQKDGRGGFGDWH
ncbi:protein of unknown function [Thauera humireducens]|nr:protein of unknown function [Thauera humireducens]